MFFQPSNVYRVSLHQNRNRNLWNTPNAFQLFTLLKKKAFLFKDCVWQPPKEHFRKATDTFKFQCVSLLFIKKHLKSLKRNKAAGLDYLPTGMIKDCCDYIAKPLCHIINLFLVTMAVPSEWKKARVIPLCKSGLVNKPENYRPKSILRILSKLLERSVQEQIWDYLEERSLISKFQFGYWANRSAQ